MKLIALAALSLAAAVSLSACATGSKLTPAQAHQMFTDFKEAGCGGDVAIDAGAAGGQLGGEAHASIGLHGKCPTALELQAAKAAAAPPPPRPPAPAVPLAVGAVVAPAAPATPPA